MVLTRGPEQKNRILRNSGKPYTVSPYDLVTDGDYYCLVGFCDERNEVRTFRADRILDRPKLFPSEVFQKPESFHVGLYTQEAFRMYASQNASDVVLRCENSVMKVLIDRFGIDIHTEPLDEDSFRADVTVCPGPTFYRWVFGWNGRIRITGPEEICREYRRMLEKALDLHPGKED